MRERFGCLEKGVVSGLAIGRDHGSACMAGDFQHERAFPGMESSPSFVRGPEGNGYAKRFLRTLKENLTLGADFPDGR